MSQPARLAVIIDELTTAYSFGAICQALSDAYAKRGRRFGSGHPDRIRYLSYAGKLLHWHEPLAVSAYSD